jgi:spore coat protein JB
MKLSQNSLLRRLQALEFTALEFNLYLDTHPTDMNALNEFNAVSAELANAKQEYEARYGPLINFGHSLSPGAWRWIEEPWPWEVSS